MSVLMVMVMITFQQLDVALKPPRRLLLVEQHLPCHRELSQVCVAAANIRQTALPVILMHLDRGQHVAIVHVHRPATIDCRLAC